MHWTYEGVSATDDLSQGDILLPTDALKQLFEAVHPHFNNPKYIGFLVTSQSCDLVRRGDAGRCASSYVNIAVVRPMAQIIGKLLDHVCTPVARGVYPLSQRSTARALLRRILDQNEWKIGLYYLHEDAAIGLGDPSVALLRVSIAVLSEHYDKLIAARRARLSPQFANKLGWMVGNLYSRIGTPDWRDHAGGGAKVKQLTKEALEAEGGLLWAPDDRIKAAKKAGHDLSVLPPTDIAKLLEQVTVKTSLDRALEEIAREARGVLGETDSVSRIVDRLRINAAFKAALEEGDVASGEHADD